MTFYKFSESNNSKINYREVSKFTKLPLIYTAAIENLQASYYSDLTNIRNFSTFRKDKSNFDYLQNFKSYLVKSGVARNVQRGQMAALLYLTCEWIDKNELPYVDGFAAFLKDKGLTHCKVMTSLASKILYLNDPWNIIPIDNIAKKAFGLKTNFYSDYLVALKKFTDEHQQELQERLISVEEVLKQIEKDFYDCFSNIEVIRYNRLIDKLINLIGVGKYLEA